MVGRNDRGVVMAEVRQQLGLKVWQLHRATEVGLLRRHPKVGYSVEDVATALADLPDFLRRLDKVTLVNATEAAKRLNVSPARFTAAAEAAQLVVQAEEQWKYGTIRYWLAADVDELVDVLVIDTAERSVRTAVGRPAAAKKAAATRARNKALAVAATKRVEVEFALCERNPVLAVRWAAALGMAFPDLLVGWTRHVGRFAQDEHVIKLCDLFETARPNAGTLARWSSPVGEYGALSAKLMTRKDAAAALRVIVHDVHVLPRVGAWVSRDAVAELDAVPPGWLILARIIVVAEHERVAEVRAAAQRESVALKAMQVAAVAFYTPLLLSETWGIQLDLIMELQPSRGWTVGGIQAVLANKPLWAESEQAARMMVELRSERRSAAAATRLRLETEKASRKRGATEARARLVAGRRSAVEEAMGMPAGLIPVSWSPARETKRSVEILELNPPKWFREWRRAEGR